jgi:acetyltransferase
VGRLSKVRGIDEAEFALLISDRFQSRGLGTALLDRLIGIGRDERVARIFGTILVENVEMQRVCQKLGFRLERVADDTVIKAVLDL